MALAENLRRIRREKDITQTELSKMTGINQVQISYYENGKRSPRVELLKAMAEALEVTTDELLK